MTRADFVQWANDESNGFAKSNTVGGVKLNVFLMPNESLDSTSKNQMADFKVTLSSSEIEKNLRKELYDNFGKEDVIKYFSFDFEYDIKLLVDGKEVEPVLCLFEQGTDLANNFSFMLSFDHEIKEDVTLSIEPRILAIGTQKFIFKITDINNKPKIDL